jgi:hypothetical protein
VSPRATLIDVDFPETLGGVHPAPLVTVIDPIVDEKLERAKFWTMYTTCACPSASLGVVPGRRSARGQLP